MLTKLTVKNVALIESAEIDFTDGLNVLSGETGSGKSVVLESVNFVLGAKADKSLIRRGAEDCFVSAEFDVADNAAVSVVLEEFGIENEGLLIITRRFSETGKNTVKINGNSATVSMLKKLTSVLVDVHGQSEHFYLLSTSNQLKLLDNFAGENARVISERIKANYAEYKSVLGELNAAGGDESARLIRLDVLNYQISEINSADIKEGEAEELAAIKDKLLHREKIISALCAVKNCISDEGGVSDMLSNAIRNLNGITGLSEDYAALYERLNGAYAELDDIASSADGFIEDLGYSEYSLDEVEERLALIKRIFKKYGGDYNAVTEFSENAEKEKDKLENFNVYAAGLNDKLLKIKKSLYADYVSLSGTRKKAAKSFAEKVLFELTELGMNKARFYVSFSEIPDFDTCKFDSSNGFDDVEFMFSANSGEPAKSLSSVISGGEMSRFMLAVKAQTAKYNDIATFIFDEIDAGISGNVARVVAEKLTKISRSVQVISVSHLPQIVSFADNNILITKTETAEKTVTSVKTLDKQSKIAEITRLLGGDKESVSATRHAEDLLDKAATFKTALK